MSDAIESASGTPITPATPSVTIPNTTHATATTPIPAPTPSSGRMSCLAALGPIPEVNSLVGLHQLATQFHQLTDPLPTNQTQQAMNNLEECIHTQLQRMDEYSELIDAFKSESQLAHSQLLPQVTAKRQALEHLFQQIHTFDQYTRELERHVAYVEARTNEVDVILKRTSTIADEYDRDAALVRRSGVNAELAQVEKAATKLWSSLKNLGSKPTPITNTTASTTATATLAPTQTILDLVDQWVPFQPCADMNEFFTQQSNKSSEVDETIEATS